MRLSVLLLPGLLLAACAQETVAHKQTEKNANKIVLLLEKSGIDTSKIKDEESRELAFNVMVPADSKTQALSILSEYNLPEEPKADSAMMVEDSGMIPTAEQERTKREVGIQGDLTNALRTIPGIIDAQVSVTLPPDNPLRDINEEPPRPKAAAMLLYRQNGNGGAPPISAEDVQKFIAARLPVIKPSEVSVTMLPSEVAMDGGGPKSSAPIIDPGIGCQKKERVLNIDVCEGNKRKVINIIIGAVIVAGLLAGMAVIAVLRAMRYRKDLTRLTAQFERVRK
jgi:type III secretion system YscJ/HrcJ family lipoprotein